MDNSTRNSETLKFLNREANSEFASRAERRLWTLLLAKKQSGERFLRNQLVDNYEVEFLCPKLSLILIIRFNNDDVTSLEIENYTVIYFSEDEIISDIEFVNQQLKNVISDLTMDAAKI